MAFVLTKGSAVQCSHTSGTVALGTVSKLKVHAEPVVVKVAGQTIDGCQWQPPPQTNVPCKTVTAASAGQATKLKVGGEFVLLDSLSGITSSNPPGSLSATANQSKLKAT